MFEHCWLIVLRGRMLRRLDPVYLAEILSHRHLRYASGLLHLGLLADERRARAARPRLRGARSPGSSPSSRLAAATAGLPRYYTLVTWATVVALVDYLAQRRAGRLGEGRRERDDARRPPRVPARPARRSASTASACAASSGHEYPFVDGIPVLVLDDADPTQPGYWSKPEQIEAVRGALPPEVEGDGVDPYVAELIIGTHGNLYRHLAEGIARYPIPAFPLPPGNGQTLLDIGCNWGRWTLAAARAGYDAIGIDPSFEAIVAARRIARQLGIDARTSSPTAATCPFRDGRFDVVFSYGVLQHFSKADVRVSLARSPRAEADGYTWVQMPNALGARNVDQLARRRFREGDALRGALLDAARAAPRRGRIVGPTALTTDGFFTLNPQTSDLDLLPRALPRARPRLGRRCRRVHALTNLADSVNVRAVPR